MACMLARYPSLSRLACQCTVSPAHRAHHPRPPHTSPVDDEGNVFVNAIYEPPQQGTADSLLLERGTAEEAHADTIARGLGWRKARHRAAAAARCCCCWRSSNTDHSSSHSARSASFMPSVAGSAASMAALSLTPPCPLKWYASSQVGWIFTQSTKERDFIMSGEEVGPGRCWWPCGWAVLAGEGLQGACFNRAAAPHHLLTDASAAPSRPQLQQIAAVQDEMGPHAVTALVRCAAASRPGALSLTSHNLALFPRWQCSRGRRMDSRRCTLRCSRHALEAVHWLCCGVQHLGHLPGSCWSGAAADPTQPADLPHIFRCQSSV